MHLMRCEHGHFYDGDKFPQCPHCVSQGVKQNTHEAGYGRGDSVTVPGSAYQEDSHTMPVSAYQEDSHTMPVSAYQEDSHTMPVSAYQEDSHTMPVSAYQEDSRIVPGSAYQEGVHSGQAPSYRQEQSRGNVPLHRAVQEAMGSVGDSDEDGKTVSFYQAKRGVDPVAGWLVCIEGEDFGNSFTIKSGRNFVGRSADMDIVLHGDNSISRVKHAVILYEPRRREFIAQAGESRELFYLNGEVVLNPVRLRQYDILTIGNTQLMFFPCCGEKFSWDDYRKNDK